MHLVIDRRSGILARKIADALPRPRRARKPSN
jgi:hypothetical protein